MEESDAASAPVETVEDLKEEFPDEDDELPADVLPETRRWCPVPLIWKISERSSPYFYPFLMLTAMNLTLATDFFICLARNLARW